MRKHGYQSFCMGWTNDWIMTTKSWNQSTAMLSKVDEG